MTDAKREIVDIAKTLGFNRVRVAQVARSVGIQQYDSYLSKGHHATMGWMVRSRPPRENPFQLLPDAKVILTLGIDYRWPTPPKPDFLSGRVAMYAWGRDYHKVINKRLKKMMDMIKERYPNISGYWGVDSRPFIERAWAERSGLGYIGKNTMLISPADSSYFFLAMLMLNIDLDEDEPILRNHCGTCQRCIDKCPTDAFWKPYQLDSTKCISYLTIEHKGSIPIELRPLIGDWLFGCDICQDVCPHNGKKYDTSGNLQDLAPKPKQPFVDLHWLLGASCKEVDDFFAGTPLRRAGAEQLKRNACVVAGNLKDKIVQPSLQRLLQQDNPLLREHAQWAIHQIQNANEHKNSDAMR